MGKVRTFRHPVQPLSDDRISILIAERGALGYGAYWMVLEALYREPSMQLPYDETCLRKLSAHTGISLHDFRWLLDDMIEVYGLLVVHDNCLSSTIAYRKPPKSAAPSVLSTAPAAISETPGSQPATRRPAPQATTPAVDTNDIPLEVFLHPELPYTVPQLRFYDRLKKYIDAKAPRVAEMRQPLTRDQVVEIGNSAYHDAHIHAIVDAMNTEARLHTRFTSAYDAFKYFATVVPMKTKPA
ncbi:MAG: DUF4373 domain-containing protein [Sphingobacteriales bacterium]|nr:MAG: DUF4373 domain-containing protein [Sphingobacteriales bacterium]